MFELEATPYFAKKLRKLVKKESSLLSKITKTLENLQVDPNNLALRSHKVKTPKFGEVKSSRVTGDIRIIWDYSQSKVQVLDLLDIGGHSGSSSVY